MAIPTLSAPALSNDYGFSCQCWLKIEVERLCYGASWIWFATSFSAHDNVDSSNPCFLYFELSRAVRLQDIRSRIIRDYQTQLLNTIENSGLSSGDKFDLKRQVLSATSEFFRPQVWGINLSKVAGRRGCSIDELRTDCRSKASAQITVPQKLQPDEYLIKDLKQTGPDVEFQVLIEG